MTHVVVGSSFHGKYEFHVRGPAEGFTLSANQAQRYHKVLCPWRGCKCGGDFNTFDPFSAVILKQEDEALMLVPATAKAQGG